MFQWFENKQCGSMLVSKHFAQTQAQTWGISLCSNPQSQTLCNFLNQINVMFESCVFGQVKSSTVLTHQCRPAREFVIARCVGKAREEFIRQLADLRKRQRLAREEDARAAKEGSATS